MMNIDFDINSVTAWAMEEQALHAMSEKMARVDVNAVLSSEDFQALILDRETRQQEGKAYRVTDGTAFIEIDGPLMKRASGFMSFLYGASSMERIGRAIEAALDDSDVERVCLLIDSPGGTVDGTAALARLVFEARGRKPILSFCHGEIMSAAIWIGTAADAVVLDNETVISGSIGVRGPTHFDMTGMAKKDGVKVEEFYKGKFKSVGSRWTPMTNEGRAHIQGVIDPINAAFVGDVAKHRGVSEKMVLSKMADARLFNGSQGIAVGLVDAVMPLSQALEQFKAGKSFKSTTQAKGVQTMDLEAKITELETKLETKATEIPT